MIKQEQLQLLKELNKPYFKAPWEYAERMTDGDEARCLKKYLAIMSLLAYRQFEWKDSEDLEVIDNG